MKSSKGFSLFELMASMVLVSFLLTMSIPFVHAIQQRFLFRQEISTFVMELHRAKMTALKNNNHVVLKVLSDGYLIFEDDGKNGGRSSDWIQQQSERTLIRRKLPATLRIQTTFTRNRTRFNGTMGVKAGKVIFADSMGNISQVVLNIVGRVRVERL